MSVRRNSIEWRILVKKLIFSKKKSNRDYLCVKCWVVLTYDQMKSHKKNLQSHAETILTSKHFASEESFMSLARQFNKVELIDEIEHYQNPYLP